MFDSTNKIQVFYLLLNFFCKMKHKKKRQKKSKNFLI